ncbi:hypothetical protein A1Q2_08453 [Trichosporon asahii var. asahii CBS 8904]|uniref:Uncharacterized protein n=2 Tax=Trichosporon asahii var. asahii TaxID=189963 RepID=K1V966_TRIAC|nr:hypothetical protein A1Q1_01140 [Trichosporon asahii var. asahii CBS 2479]EJT49718.1 hypothetical protein A1Q1_01140 [Trichosporon asahii var. asahii CBS 2479]EKC97235.1 hypothetical protein A1Q2_08453 [Trichosporon asahii var. asahii CBS 8904]
MSAINHSTFPLMFDAVWDAMDTATVLACRNVDSRWRKRADQRLQQHMMLLPAISRADADPSNLAYTAHLPATLCSRDAPHIASLRCELPPPDAPIAVLKNTMLSIKPTFSNLRVLDVDCSGELHGAASLIGPLFVATCPHAIFRAFVPTESLGQVVGVGREQVFFMDLERPAKIITYKPNPVILNLRCDAEENSPFQFVQSMGGADLWHVLDHQLMYKRHAVCICGFLFTIANVDLSYLDSLSVWLGCSSLPTHAALTFETQITLVGFERLFTEERDYRLFKHYVKCRYSGPLGAPGALDLGGRGAGEQFMGPVDPADVRSPVLADWTVSPLRRLLVRVLTRQEYEDEVGSEKFTLYTVW